MIDQNQLDRIQICACCGGNEFNFHPVLWPALVNEWALSDEESNYIDRQQGISCKKCNNNLRSIALAKAILSARKHKGNFFSLLRSPRTWNLKTLEINTAGTLTRNLAKFGRRTLANYPDVDMQKMPYENNSFDFVIHSDTLEHVPNPNVALSECLRVLKPGGFCCFTIPIIVGRTTKSRKGLPHSYHGGENDEKDDYVVQTEYGCDFWCQVLKVGFEECRIVKAEFPAAQAIAARKAL
jgi:SAM-dependent methyltransferase